jgi:DNA polymerase-1
VPVFEKEGFEADDVVGTLAFLATKESSGPEVVILSSDNDFLQLVNDRVKVLILKKGVSQSVFYDEQAVRQKYEGLSPLQLVDFKALRGDASDNIIGVPGVGEKTALKLLLQVKNLETLFSEIEQMSLAESLRQKLIASKEQAFVSQRLARIRCDVPISFSLEDCLWGRQDWEKVVEVFRGLHFFSLLSRLGQLSGKEIK